MLSRPSKKPEGTFRFCPYCGDALQPFMDENQERLACPECPWVHYRNPTVGVAVIVRDQDRRLLLGLRRRGGWCIPCGHVEWDESVEQAAVREFHEETGLHVRLQGVFAVKSNFHRPAQQTVGIWYHGTVLSGRLCAGGDLTDVQFFSLDQLPTLVYPTDREVCQELVRC